jgi:hypothetical protein
MNNRNFLFERHLKALENANLNQLFVYDRHKKLHLTGHNMLNFCQWIKENPPKFHC